MKSSVLLVSVYCVAGQSGNETTGCKLCPDNQIKPQPGLDQCSECVGNFTANVGRTSCDVGKFNINYSHIVHFTQLVILQGNCTRIMLLL